jgi:signal transduction histidine kinase
MAASISLNDEPAPIEKLIHDLSIPLGIMKLNLDLLQQQKHPDYLKRLNLGWEKMDLILKQRTSYRVYRSAKYLSELIDEVLELFGTGINRQGIIVIKNYEMDLRIKDHQDKLVRIIINLINNSIESLHSYLGHKQIRVSCKVKAKYLRVNIYNSGPAFPEAILNDLGKCPILKKDRNRGKGIYNSAQLLKKYFKGRIIFQNPARGGANVLILIPQYILGNE